MINTALKLKIIMDLYEFEYHFLPYLVNECSQRKLDPRALADKNFIKETVEANSENVPWNWDDFQINVCDIGDSPVLMYKFPEPDMTPLARFAAITVDNQGANYYTLEYNNYKNKVSWYFCMTNEKGRTNLGQVDECATIEDFARFIGENVFKIQSKSGEKKSWFTRILNFFKK